MTKSIKMAVVICEVSSQVKFVSNAAIIRMRKAVALRNKMSKMDQCVYHLKNPTRIR